ncbi:hypothetical protein MON38_10540 [Hymenobacter sp. DH14]|uniref:Uncharacterized protein n=1 Tax=Hymenobacter cyanobacteriorum TaxID=2926463 RepID=A0A9X1VFW7_9BACT|nr:hypothetical protein [Hymenobacter cyanobacteriorum]MCI1187858.1 hypothetical protein [Hymenobacter cyanobacteriorum]
MHGIITQGVAHVHHAITSLTIEHAAAIIGGTCAVGRLLLQYLSFRRGKSKQ